MAAPREVLVTSESSGQLWNFCVWDVFSGAALASYKGGCSAQHTLSILAGEYFISATHGKPLIHVWAVQRKDQPQVRIVCPGVVSSLVTTPDGIYCLAGIAEKIYMWQISTGNLLAVVSRHYQTVTCLRITDDGSHFVSGGDDNLVMVWSLASVLQESQTGQGVDPLHIWSNHSLPITDIYCTAGGVMARVVSASQDQTCKISIAQLVAQRHGCMVSASEAKHARYLLHSWWLKDMVSASEAKHARVVTNCSAGDTRCLGTAVYFLVNIKSRDTDKVWDMCSGELLCSLVFDVPIYSVCMDPSEYRLFAGAMNGSIIQANLFTPNAERERHLKSSFGDEDEDSTTAFIGHSKPVTCLSVSLDGSMLISGSQDQTVRVWHISSKQCIRTTNHKGAVTNALIIPTPANLQNSHTKPTLPIQSFKRYLHVPGQGEGMRSTTQQHHKGGGDVHRETVEVRLKATKSEKVLPDIANEADRWKVLAALSQTTGATDEGSSTVSVGDLQQKVQHLEQLNKDLFTYAAKQILHPT